MVLFATGTAATATIQRVSAAGGAATPVTALDTSRQEVDHIWPHFLPDGKHFLYLAGNPAKPENNAIYVGSLDSKERTLLLSATSNAVYSPPGYLLYHREGTLLAQPFDAERIQLSGEPVPIAEGVQFNAGGRAAFAASENGVLAYRAEVGPAPRTLVWVTRSGANSRWPLLRGSTGILGFPPMGNGWSWKSGNSPRLSSGFTISHGIR